MPGFCPMTLVPIPNRDPFLCFSCKTLFFSNLLGLLKPGMDINDIK